MLWAVWGSGRLGANRLFLLYTEPFKRLPAFGAFKSKIIYKWSSTGSGENHWYLKWNHSCKTETQTIPLSYSRESRNLKKQLEVNTRQVQAGTKSCTCGCVQNCWLEGPGTVSKNALQDSLKKWVLMCNQHAVEVKLGQLEVSFVKYNSRELT